MSSLSKYIGSSGPECSRHILRLSDSGLVKRKPSGLYEATPMGRTVIKLLPAVEVLVQHRDYFMTHDLSGLPEQFTQRIGSLNRAEYHGHFSDVLQRIKATLSEAKEYSCLMVDQPILVASGDMGNLGSSNHRAKFIFNESVDRKVPANVKAAYPRSEIALLDGVNIATGVTERAAGVIFPLLGGKLDFESGFFGGEDQFHAWCGDLFDYYWARSRAVH